VELDQEAKMVQDERNAAEALKKKISDELAQQAAIEAAKRMTKDMNMLDTSPFNARNMLDLLKNPMRAMDGCQNWLW